MKAISKLKDEARRYEQREEWEKAIQAYLQVLRNADDGEAEVDLPLYNRVGDLCVRLGRPQEAVQHYEQAADRYAEAGLYNNAIALCNKALRYSPDRMELVRKLGQFSASQGFITDARRHFLDYAERQFRAGRVNDALTALEDFANVSEDPEIREMLGRQLHAHGRTNDGLDELRRAHAMRVAAGETDVAEALRQEILSLDPRASVEGAPAAPPSPAGGAAAPAAELPGLAEIEVPDQDFEIGGYEAPEPQTTDGLETGALPGDDVDAIALTGFEATGEPVVEDVGSGADAIEGLESTTLDFASIETDAAPLPELSIDQDVPSFAEGASRDAETFDLDELDADGADDLPTLDDARDGAFDLPLLGDDDEATPLPTLEEPPAPAEPPPPPIDPLAGDLRIDLNSLGGFTLPSSGAPAATPEPTVPEPAAPEPIVQKPAAPEPAPEPPAPAVPPAPIAEAGPAPVETGPDPVPAEPPALPDVPAAEEPEPVVVPAIELPTWDTAPSAPGDEEPYEASWVDTATVEEEEEPAAELPTFEYEEEADAPVAEAEVPEDPDPLGLAAHLKAAPTPPAPPRAPEPVESGEDTAAWLDEIEDEEEPAPWEVPAEPLASPDGIVRPDATAPAPSVEDTAFEEQRAGEAADAMSAPPSNAANADFVDLGALVHDDTREESTRFRVQETAPTGDEDRDFAELLSQFKSKVQEHLPPEDAAAHYDLGLAYKEMGLIDEAIGEFQIALRDGHMRLRVYEELGHCFLQKEQYNIAEKVLVRALEMKYDDELELLGVYYHLGRAYEALGRREQARDAYERVLGMDINFEDVTARLTRL